MIALESTKVFGSDHTSAPLHNLLHSIFGAAIDPDWNHIHHLIRKAGHFTGYGMLSLVCFRGFHHSLRSHSNKLAAQILAHTLAIAAAFAIAGADELHQCFLPNRTGCFADVLLDTAGALTLQLVVWLLLYIQAMRPSADPIPSCVLSSSAA